MARKAHYRGSYQSQARALVLAAQADWTTRCWRCGLMLHEHQPHRNGRAPFWTAGHIVDSDPASPLAPEASTCNFAAGLRTRNRRNLGTTRNW
jgi:hypothetical protein